MLISDTNKNYAYVVFFGVFPILNFIEICKAVAGMNRVDRQSYPPHLLIYNLLYPPHCVLISRTLYTDRSKVGQHRLFPQGPLIYHSPSNLIPPRAKADRAV